WYENLNGSGSFGPQKVISTAAGDARSVFAADLDGDGDADVLSASWSDNRIAWYENLDGLGGFGPQQVVSTSLLRAASVFARDVYGDGDMDVLSASDGDDKIAWYENVDGLGSFGPQRVISTSADGAYCVFATDLDGDGDADVLSASDSDGKIAWYENTNGLGSFGPQQVISTTTYNGPMCVFAGDLDGDGDADVLSASHCYQVAWYENTNGLATFGPQRVISTAVSGAWCVYATDLDGDGDADVLSASADDDKIAWYENDPVGAGDFGAQQVITIQADGARDVLAADLDGDGDADVLSASLFDNKIAWYENTDGQGSFAPQQVISNAANGAWCVYAADLDGDGDPDVLSASVIQADGARDVLAADLDGDGDADVLSASSNDDKIAWYENTNGQGSFGPQQVISTAAGWACSVFATDLDGDGDIDVLSASTSDYKIAWYENTNGLGNFGPQQVVSTAVNGAWCVFATDVDGDGDADVLSASSNDDKIAWYENTSGLGLFGPQQVISTAADSAWSVFATDLDGDGDADVLSASMDDYKIAWYENTNGVGSFGPERVITWVGQGAGRVFAADVDGDGDPDALSASLLDDKIAWYENLMGVCQADLGYQGPGSASLIVWGQALSSGKSATFVLSGALPGAATLLFVSPSFSPTYVFEAGGFLCPILPPVAILFLSASQDGEILFPGGVPGGGGPLSIHVQAACQDAGQPMGWSISNCVRIDLLP
ncbi:MAG: VCBS repeat-containing protein, partial [Planctomycetes bacterium]|nr:VCBS repeat-containing protein [Planctomycetota bacterium]